MRSCLWIGPPRPASTQLRRNLMEGKAQITSNFFSNESDSSPHFLLLCDDSCACTILLLVTTKGSTFWLVCPRAAAQPRGFDYIMPRSPFPFPPSAPHLFLPHRASFLAIASH